MPALKFDVRVVTPTELAAQAPPGPGRSDQSHDLRITQGALGRPPGPCLVVGRRGDLDAVFGEHTTDRLDPVDLAVLVDEVD